MEITGITSKESEERCPRCHALLFVGKLLGQISCRKCNLIIEYDVRRVPKENRG
jgi:hypothetical protein